MSKIFYPYYKFNLPPIYPQIKHKDRYKWGLILDLINEDIDNYNIEEYPPYPYDKLSRLYHIYSIKTTKYSWIKLKLDEYLKVIFDDDYKHNTPIWKGYGIYESILPYLIEQNKFLFKRKNIFMILEIYMHYGSDYFHYFPSKLSKYFIKFLNNYISDRTLNYKDEIIAGFNSEHQIRKSIDRFFPYYELDLDNFEDLQRIDEDEDSMELKRLEWKAFCSHLNYYSDNPSKIEEIMEDALYSIKYEYGVTAIFDWMKHFQYFLDNDDREIEADALPIIRRWLNELFEYYYRKRSYIPFTLNGEYDENFVQLYLIDTYPSESERNELFNKITKEQTNNYSSFEKALIIYLKEETKEVEPTLENTQDSITGGSYKNVWNKYLDLKRYLNPEKRSTISKKLFKAALEKIIDDKSLKKYHYRAKSILQNEI